MLDYLYSATEISVDQLKGFFVWWTNPPSRETHLRLLQQSDEVVLAQDTSNGAIVGFITAIANGVFTA